MPATTGPSDNPDKPRLKPARPTGADESEAYLPRIPWRIVLLGVLSIGTVAAGHILSERKKADALREQIVMVHEQQLAEPDSRLRQALSGILRALGSAIAEDPALQARMDQRLQEGVQTLIVPWRKEIGRFVADVVRSWETRTIVDRVELAVGKDLQYIRLNGTLVGAAVGCGIFVLTHLLG